MEDGDDRRQRRVRSGRLSRVAMLGGMAARLAGDAASAATRLAATAAREEAARRLHERAARTLARSFGEMKGLPMKVGQMLSYIDDFVPAEHRDVYRETLRSLQVRAQPMMWASIEEMLREDLGGEPDEIFAEFDREPIAAASIGQVHRAKTRDGRCVAVKVQYPGIADAIGNDLKNFDAIVSALSAALPRFDIEQSVEDLTSRLTEECDYRVERANQEAFAAAWADDDTVVIPAVVPQLCGQRVLVTELIEGLRWDEMLAQADDALRNQYGQVIFRFVFHSLYVHGMFNADPHPGNYLFLPSGRVAFLDFGCVQRFDKATLAGFVDVRQRALQGMRGTPFREAFARSYGVPRDLDEDLWRCIEDYMYLSFEPAIAPQPYRYSRSYTERLARQTMQLKVELGKRLLKIGIFDTKRTGVVFLHRINFGLNSILATLGAEADFKRMVEDINAASGLLSGAGDREATATPGERATPEGA